MEPTKTYEKFPVWIVLLSNLVAISIYAIGAYILAGLGILLAVLYLLYCLWFELKVIRKGYMDCYYYDKVCGFGKGRLFSIFFKKGDPQRFVKKDISWSPILPDFLVLIFPVIGGIIQLVMLFSWFLMTILAFIVVLYFGGNAVIRGTLTCKYCKQREIGCPAEKLYSKEET